jgi:hypothetical protein
MSSIHDYTFLLYNIDIFCPIEPIQNLWCFVSNTSGEMLKYYRNLRESSNAYNSRTAVLKYQLVQSWYCVKQICITLVFTGLLEKSIKTALTSYKTNNACFLSCNPRNIFIKKKMEFSTPLRCRLVEWKIQYFTSWKQWVNHWLIKTGVQCIFSSAWYYNLFYSHRWQARSNTHQMQLQSHLYH